MKNVCKTVVSIFFAPILISLPILPSGWAGFFYFYTSAADGARAECEALRAELETQRARAAKHQQMAVCVESRVLRAHGQMCFLLFWNVDFILALVLLRV